MSAPSPFRLLPLIAAAMSLGAAASAAQARAAAPVAAVPQAAVRFLFAAGRLSGRASGVSLGEALRALQHGAGGELVGLRAVEHEVVSFDVADLPLEQALASLLRHRNFMAVIARRSDGDRLVRLVIGAGGESEPGESTRRDTRRDPSVSAPTPASAPANEPIGELHSRALHGQSPGDRIAAIEALDEVGAAEDPERVTTTLQAAVEGDPDPRVRQAALEGLRMHDALGLPLLLDAVRHDSEPAIRLAVLEDLRARAMEDPRIYEAVDTLAASDADATVRTAAESLRDDMRAAGARPQR